MDIEMGGRRRQIKFNYNAIADLESIAGCSIDVLFSSQNFGFNFTRMLVWAGLKHAEPGLTIQRAGMLIEEATIKEGATLSEITMKFLEALQSSRQFSSGSDEKNAQTE